jgi:hypothetical protein
MHTRSMRRLLKRSVLALAALVFLIQLWPVHRENPPADAPLVAPPAVEALLRRSCYDCHSNETRWPWYAYVAPMSWLVVHDVDEGRAELNFSIWGRYSASKRSSKASTAIEEIEEGRMPLPKYVRIHADAQVSPADLAVLRAWADEVQ